MQEPKAVGFERVLTRNLLCASLTRVSNARQCPPSRTSGPGPTAGHGNPARMGRSLWRQASIDSRSRDECGCRQARGRLSDDCVGGVDRAPGHPHQPGHAPARLRRRGAPRLPPPQSGAAAGCWNEPDDRPRPAAVFRAGRRRRIARRNTARCHGRCSRRRLPRPG